MAYRATLHTARCRAIGARAFTLVELLVALAAGLLVMMSAVAFSRVSTRMFAEESRMAAAQMSVVSGFQRLQADAARASYMASSDMQRDYNLGRSCMPTFDSLPESLRTLSGIRVTKGTYSDQLRIAGNLVSAEMFPVLSIEPTDGGGHTVYFQSNNGPMTRSGVLATGDKETAFRNIFLPGRVLRIIDQDGKPTYQIIRTSSYETVPQVTTAGPLPLRGELAGSAEESGASGVAAPCGINGYGVGLLANPIVVVNYELVDLMGMDIPLYSQTVFRSEYGVEANDAGRVELVRTEQLFSEDGGSEGGEAVPELVTEFGVSFSVGLWATTGPGKPVYLQGDEAYAATVPSTDPTDGLATSGPASVRALDIRLAVRSRDADRTTDVDTSALPTGYQYRVPVGNRFARVRTLTAMVALVNQRGDAW